MCFYSCHCSSFELFQHAKSPRNLGEVHSFLPALCSKQVQCKVRQAHSLNAGQERHSRASPGSQQPNWLRLTKNWIIRLFKTWDLGEQLAKLSVMRTYLNHVYAWPVYIPRTKAKQKIPVKEIYFEKNLCNLGISWLSGRTEVIIYPPGRFTYAIHYGHLIQAEIFGERPAKL